MIKDVLTILWKEWKELFYQHSGRNKVRLLVAFTLLGILLPYQIGPVWFTNRIFYVLAIISPILMLTSVISDLFVGERERHTLEALLYSRLPDKSILLGKLSFAISYSISMTLFVLVLNIVSINLKYYEDTLIIFSPLSALLMLGLNFVVALLASLIGAAISFNFSTVKAAQQTLTISIVILAFAPLLFPVKVQTSLIDFFKGLGMNYSFLFLIVFLLILNLGLLIYMISKYKRTKLII